MSPSSAPTRLALLLSGAAILASCSVGTAAPPPTPTPTKTPKPTYTATTTATATPAQPSTATATPAPEVPPTDTVTATPAVPPTETDTPTPEPTDTPSVPPTATFTPGPPPPTNTPAPPPTPTPMPFQYTGQVIWDEGSANCAFLEIRSASVITDTAGNPVNDVCVCVNLFDNILKSWPSGPAAPNYKDPGHYDISPVLPYPDNISVNAYVCDCSSGAPANSQQVQIQFESQNCSPGQGGHQSAIVNWTKHW